MEIFWEQRGNVPSRILCTEVVERNQGHCLLDSSPSAWCLVICKWIGEDAFGLMRRVVHWVVGKLPVLPLWHKALPSLVVMQQKHDSPSSVSRRAHREFLPNFCWNEWRVVQLRCLVNCIVRLELGSYVCSNQFTSWRLCMSNCIWHFSHPAQSGDGGSNS